MITDILRGKLGFNKIVITDAMNMGAVTNYYDSGQAAVMAIQAGDDMSDEKREAMFRLRRFMFERVYTNPIAKSEEEKVDNMPSFFVFSLRRNSASSPPNCSSTWR